MLRHPFRRAARQASRTASMLAVALTAVGAAHVPAQADFCPRLFRDEADLLAVSETCRETYLLNAGVGNYAGRDQIWRARDLYRSLGFNDDYLAWAPVETITITADSPEMWGHCTDTTRPPDAPCPAGAVAYTRVAANFTQFPVALRVIRFGNAVLYLGCGNDGNPHAFVPAPAPKIVGSKFEDTNRNGVRDAGEQPLSGVVVTLVRESTRAEEPLGVVETAVTDGDGRYVFDMHGRRPGGYRVDETVPTGWRQTTTSPRVDLDWGAGNGEIVADPIGNARVADVAKVDFTVTSAPDRLDVGVESEFVVRVTVANLGPYPEVTATDYVDVVPPEDCVATVLDPVRELVLNVGQPVTFDVRVRTDCDHRSDHRWVFHDRLEPGPDFEDPDLTNNTRSTDVERPVFEQLNLSVAEPHITCIRPSMPTRYECSVTAVVSNGLSATPASTRTTTTLTGPADCLVTSPIVADHVLGSGASIPVSASFVADCGPGPHSFVANIQVTETEIHGEESDAGDNETRIRWVQTDVKPNSDPSSINLTKNGVVPVAILSTPDFDAVGQVSVDPETLLFGATGTEQSLLGCAVGGEDVNGDNLLDLVCHFDTARAGFTCETTLGRMVGVLRDGTPFASQDPVKIAPCRRA